LPRWDAQLVRATCVWEDSHMNKRFVIASALTAAISAPMLASAQGGPAPTPNFKAEKW